MEVSKQDWKLFCEKISAWQEAYMEKLNHEYVKLLEGDGVPSEKFWALEKRIKIDKKHKGVLIEMRKQNMPFDLVDLEQRVLEATNQVEIKTATPAVEQDLRITLTRMLHELGVPSHIKGYQYIREGILILYNNPDIIGGITKELYPEIANRFDTSVSRVERAIRHAIEVSWNRGNLDLMEEIFGHSVDYDKAKPTNSEFIVTVADKLKLEFRSVKI